MLWNRLLGALLCWKNGLPAELHYNTWIADRAIRFLTSRQEADQPFFYAVLVSGPTRALHVTRALLRPIRSVSDAIAHPARWGA